jgi:hypothetical protein
MVIIEIDRLEFSRTLDIETTDVCRTCTSEDWRRLLGGHRWKEFLVSPSPDEEDRVSKIFYCQYTTGRQVQKTGAAIDCVPDNFNSVVVPIKDGSGYTLKFASFFWY